jgi:short-subunit dehydrogenase
MRETNNFSLLAVAAIGALAGIAIAKKQKQKKFSFRDRVVLITGGSRGLGLVLARQLAAKGARLALIARDEEELERAKHQLESETEILTVRCDVRNREEVNEAVTRTVTQFGRIDALINNAGIIQVGPFEEMTIEDFEDTMAVHFFGPLYFTLAALPHFRANGGGRIVNIASVGGKIAVPHLLPYAASKFALVGLSDGLRAELRRQNIFVTTVCPGLMRTGSPRNAMFKGRHKKEYTWFSISDSLPLLSVNVERAARKIIETCRRGQSRLVIGAHTKAAVMLNEIFPGAATTISSIANRLLPKADSGTSEIKMGYESESFWSRSWLTKLTKKAARKNNQLLQT